MNLINTIAEGDVLRVRYGIDNLILHRAADLSIDMGKPAALKYALDEICGHLERQAGYTPDYSMDILLKPHKPMPRLMGATIARFHTVYIARAMPPCDSLSLDMLKTSGWELILGGVTRKKTRRVSKQYAKKKMKKMDWQLVNGGKTA